MARRRRRSKSAKAPHTRKPHVANVPGVARAHVGAILALSAAERLPLSGFHSDTGALPALELRAQAKSNSGITGTTDIAGAGMLDLVLEVVGAEHLTLQQHLALWQREQDRQTNRAWRRPGGLARPAGL